MLPVTTASEAARVHFERGRTAAHHYQFAQARDHLDAALRADPDFVLALLHRGGSAEDPDGTRVYLERAHSLRDRVTEGEQALIDAFRAFLVDRDYERAIDVLSALADSHPDDPYLAAYLGFRYFGNLKRPEEGAEQFRRALERDPGFVQAYHWLGYIALAQDDLATAEAMFVRYLELAPDQPRPHHAMATLLLRQGRYEEAAQGFERALAIEPRFTESRKELDHPRFAQASAPD